MKTIDTADRLDCSLNIVLQQEIESFEKDTVERRKAEQQASKGTQPDAVPEPNTPEAK